MIKIEFNEEFKQALKLLETSPNHLFITGRAGTGKSTLLTFFREHTHIPLVVLSPTGVGAVNIDGLTIHSFFHFFPNVTIEEAKKMAKRLSKNKIYQKIRMIIIDEISMVRADLLDCVDEFLKIVRKDNQPFGGLKMVFIGDLYQLPPVVTNEEKEVFGRLYATPYFFEARVIKQVIGEEKLEFLELTKIYRQSEEKFIVLLNSIRNKTIDEEQLFRLNERVLQNTEGVKDDYIYLTSLNKQAEEINRLSLDKISGRKYLFEGKKSGKFEEKYLPTEINIFLKKGARVMLVNNDNRGRWINGTLGTVTGITREKIWVSLDEGEKEEVLPYTWEIYRSAYNEKTRQIDKETIGTFTQFPLKLAWAVTVHKSQGKTFDRVIVDFGRGTFAHGQAYVALSRCRTFNGLVLKKPLKRSHVLMDWRVIKFLTNFRYDLSVKKVSTEDKIRLIKEAIQKRAKLKITYLKSKDEKSKRIILPKKIGTMEYEGYQFLGLEAFCFLRKEERIFRVEKILEINTSSKNGC